jgi:hypothetical protein
MRMIVCLLALSSLILGADQFSRVLNAAGLEGAQDSHKRNSAHVSDFGDMAQDVNIILSDAGIDPRQSYEEYAETYRTPEGDKLTLDEVYDKFSAGGQIFCPKPNGKWARGSATIVDRPNVSLMSAHELYDEKCQSRTGSEDFRSCVFQTIPRPPMQPDVYDVKSIRVGTKCPYTDKDVHDWVVITLERPVKGIHPFLISQKCHFQIEWGGMSLAAFSQNFRDGKSPMVTTWCTMKNYNQYAGEDSSSYKSSCPASPGASGGALLCDRGRKTPEIGGLMIAGSEGDKSANYSEFSNYSVAIPISEEIEAAIRAAGN